MTVTPAAGPTLGGTRINVSITPAHASSRRYCRFGTRLADASPGTVVAPGVVECIAPAHPTGFTPLEVSTNLVDFSSDGHTFEFISPYSPGATARALSLLPDHGPTSGGTLVRSAPSPRALPIHHPVPTRLALFGR